MTLFASSGIGEHYLEELGIDVVVSNELIEKRCSLYNKLYPKSRMICGDINDQKIKDELSDYKVDIVIASPDAMRVVGQLGQILFVFQMPLVLNCVLCLMNFVPLH